MTWPQVVALAMFAIAFCLTAVGSINDRTVSSGTAAFSILLHMAWQVVFAVVLHAGGFW